MSKAQKLLDEAESCAAIGTEPQLSEFRQMVTSDRRLCAMCIMYGVGCDEHCRMAEILGDVITYALYRTQTAVVPRAMLHYALEQCAHASSMTCGTMRDGTPC